MNREPFFCDKIVIVLPKNEALTKLMQDNQQNYLSEKTAYISV